MINWGIIGLGNIAKRFADSLKNSDVGKLYAGASLTKNKREYFQNTYNIITYDNYINLLNDENIDVVYIAVPHKEHYKWIKQSLLHNKAVLCEKPITLSVEEIDELIEIANMKHVFFMEGMKSRFIPMTKQIKKVVDDKTIGDILRIENSFCYNTSYNENHYLFDKEQGGIIFDCGIYNIASILQFIDSEVTDIKVDYIKKYGVDVDTKVELTFASGQSAYMENSMIANRERVMKIIGTKGTITLNPFYRPVDALVEFDNGESFTGTLPYQFDDFYHEIEEVHNCLSYIKIESPLMTHQDSRKCIELMLKIKEKIV